MLLFFDRVIFKDTEPVISAFMSAMFHGTEDGPSRPLGDDRPVRIIKNIFADTKLFIIGNALFAERTLAEQISTVARVAIAPVITSAAFRFEYRIGDLSVEERVARELPVQDRPFVDGFVTYLAERYRVDHTDHWVEVRTRNISCETGSTELLRIGDDEQGLTDRDVRLSRDLVRQHGLVWSSGYFCNRAVAAVLKDAIASPFFGKVPLG